MIDIDVARKLRDAGLTWKPADGDHFVIDVEEMRDESFMLSSMVVEQASGRTGMPLLRFNGTTEWALDSVEKREVVWVPREDQLREELADGFLALHRLEDDTYSVTLRTADGTLREIPAPFAEDALAGALLVRLTGS